ncbi:hypothetical protein NECAME_08722 [Necator americanus]|uniref:Uncharacterized protein n=1 Tax=Necator americanus TaxID=51031 RepID=W2TIW7_NECAM|nr:hypothetical protein NECAME_08722 [Necator americanus]ETN81101.1 hypothetical protein NECAME_08722 [Necator americanus]
MVYAEESGEFVSALISKNDPDDRLLKRYGEVQGTTFAWRVQLAGLIETDSLQNRVCKFEVPPVVFEFRFCPTSCNGKQLGHICSEGREFVMRKQEGGQWGRLSSSATAIRSGSYTTPRNYGPSLSSYRYSASSYTPSTRPPAPPTSGAATTPEPSYGKPAAARSPAFSPSTFATGPGAQSYAAAATEF